MPDERRFLEMDDGARVAVTLHFPETPPPWPVVFEARLYRNDDMSVTTGISRRPEIELEAFDDGERIAQRRWTRA
jgi:hypothetical protein